MVIAIIFLGCAILYAGYKIASSVDRLVESCDEENVTHIGVGMTTET